MALFPVDGAMSHALRGSKIRGAWPAIVVENKDGEGNPGYRVKLKFPWLNEQDATFWARIAVPMGGTDRGTYVLPEIDDQVVVVFEHGDIHRPIVVGSLWSKKQEPVEVNQSGKNNTKLIKSRAGHRIIFDDKDGAEKLVIVDKTGSNKIVLDSVNKIVKLESDGDIEIKAKTNVVLHSNALKIGTSEGVSGKGQSLLVHSAKTFSLKATSGITIGGGNTTINTSNAAACSVSGSGAGELGGAAAETPVNPGGSSGGGSSNGGGSSGGGGSGNGGGGNPSHRPVPPPPPPSPAPPAPPACSVTGVTPPDPTVFIHQSQTFTATGTAVAGVKWTAPNGSPAAGTGATLTTQWARPGKVTVRAACGGTSHTATAHVVDVEIQINNSAAAADDVVRVKSTTPAERPTVPCRIRLLGNAATAQTVVLTNPDGRLRFPAAADTTKTVNLPTSGAWVAFDLSGETISAAVGDAQIEVHLNSAGGALLARKAVTAFVVELEINNSPALNDDFVPLHSVSPARRPVVPARARLAPAAPAATNVVLTNPDGRLRFPNPANTTLTLTLAANGAWSAFDLSGETISAASGDAKLEAHQSNAGGTILGRKDATVVNVEIEINNTPATTDDFVQLKCEHPAHRSVVHCRARVVPALAGDLHVVLVNPDSRLRFPNAADTTKALVLAAAGTWIAFDISGEAASVAPGDAAIEARLNTAGGPLMRTKDATVFSFEPASIAVTAGGNFALVGNQYTVTGSNAANFRAQATLRPAGLSCAAPQITDLRIGIMQESSQFFVTTTWSTPVVTWAPGVPSGTPLTVPDVMRQTTSYAAAVVQPVADTEANVAPLYDQPGKPSTLDPNSLKPPIGCAGGAAATSFDTPSWGAPPTFAQQFRTGGVPTASVTWTVRVNTTRREHFRTFCVVFNTVTQEFCALREATWDLNVDSSGPAANQHAAITASAPATATPATGVAANNAVNTTVTAAVGAATTTFVSP